jgi:hypothetical protein
MTTKESLLRNYVRKILLEMVHDAPELDVVAFSVGDEVDELEEGAVNEESGTARAGSGSAAQNEVAVAIQQASPLDVTIAYVARTGSTNPDVIFDVSPQAPDPATDDEIERGEQQPSTGRFVRAEVKSDKSGDLKFTAEIKRESSLAEELQLTAQDFVDATVDPQLRISSTGRRRAKGSKISDTFQKKVQGLGLDPNAFVNAYAKSLADATENDDAYFAIVSKGTIYVWKTGNADPLGLKAGKLSAQSKWQADVAAGDRVVKVGSAGNYTVKSTASGADEFTARPKITMYLDPDKALQLPITGGDVQPTMADRYAKGQLRKSLSAR